MLETKIEKLLRYLKQPSTWQGLTLIAGAMGYSLTPEYQAAIVAGGAILLGLLQCFKDDDKGNPAEPVTKPMSAMDIVRVVAAAKQKGLLMLLLVPLLAVGCATSDNAVNNALEQSGPATAAYLICKNNPEAIPPMQAVCLSPDDQLARELADLYALYDGAIEDTFLKMQADILLQALMDEYGLNLADPAVDLSKIGGGELRPFVDAVCLGVAAASSQ